MSRNSALSVFAVLFLVFAMLPFAQAQMPNPYGQPISLDAAKKLAAPAIAEAVKNNWTIAVAIVDPTGNLIYFEKMDNTQWASSEVSIEKARTAAIYKRSTKALQDALAAGGEGLRILGLRDATPVDGGIPIVVDGKIIGAIGVSGDSSAHDGQCAKAAVDSLKP